MVNQLNPAWAPSDSHLKKESVIVDCHSPFLIVIRIKSSFDSDHWHLFFLCYAPTLFAPFLGSCLVRLSARRWLRTRAGLKDRPSDLGPPRCLVGCVMWPTTSTRGSASTASACCATYGPTPVGEVNVGVRSTCMMVASSIAAPRAA